MFNKMSIVAGLVVAAVSATSVQAAQSFTGIYSQNFDSIFGTNYTTSTTAVTNYAYASQTQSQIASTSITNWQVAKIAGNGSSNFNAFVDNGASNTGAVFSYGTSGSSDRALGVIASGSNVLAIGADFTNDTGSTITELTISYRAEQWRSSTNIKNALAFAYGVDGSGITSSNFLSSSSMTAVTALNASGLDPVTTNGATDGNSNYTNVSYTITGLNIAAGQTFFIRWSDTNDSGNDAGIGIDDFNMSASTTPAPEPASVGILALAGAGLLLRKKK